MVELDQQVSDGLDRLESEAVGAGDDLAGDDVAAAVEAMSSAELVEFVVGMVFAVVAGRRGKHWELTSTESRRLGVAGGAVMDKYMPSFKAGPEMALVVAAGVIVLPRLMRDKGQAEKPVVVSGDKSEHDEE